MATSKRINDFKRLLKADGIVALTPPHQKDGRVRATLKAENGTTREFSLSNGSSDDMRADMNERGRWRRWLASNSASHDLPGMEIVGVEVLDIRRKNPTNLQLAAKAVAHAHDPVFLEQVGERLAGTNSPIDVNNLLVTSAASFPPDEGNPPVEQATDEIDDLLAQAITESIPLTQPKEPDMARATLTIANPQTQEDKDFVALQKMHPDNVRIIAKRRNRTLSQVDFFKLCSTLSALDMTGLTSIPKLTAKLREQTGIDLSESTVTGALEATGKSLDAPPRIGRTTATEKLLATELVRLMKHLGEQPSNEVLAIAGAEA